MKLSLIIPVYNVEEYIYNCLSSCIDQINSSDEVEIIVVNDGSTDNSINVIKSKFNNIPCIKLVSQDNEGLSSARNTGLKCAKGEYVWFIDSDDWIASTSLSTIMTVLLDKKVDAIAFSYATVRDSEINECVLRSSNSIISGKDYLNSNFYVQVPFYVFRRQFLLDNKLQFRPAIYHEDFEFTPRMLYHATQVLICDNIFYYYRLRSNSITSTFSLKRVSDMFIVANSLKCTADMISDTNVRARMYDLVCMAVNNALSYIVRNLDVKSINEFEKEITSDLLICFRKAKSFKYLFEYYMFRVMPFSIIELYRYSRSVVINIRKIFKFKF